MQLTLPTQHIWHILIHPFSSSVIALRALKSHNLKWEFLIEGIIVYDFVSFLDSLDNVNLNQKVYLIPPFLLCLPTLLNIQELGFMNLLFFTEIFVMEREWYLGADGEPSLGNCGEPHDPRLGQYLGRHQPRRWPRDRALPPELRGGRQHDY